MTSNRWINYNRIKFLIPVIFFLLGTFVTAQQKNCNTINGGLCTYCIVERPEILSDRITVVIADSCDLLFFVDSINAVWMVYYEDSSTLRQIASFLNGEQHGEHSSYYRNGALRSKNYYIHGSLTGSMLLYYPDGKLQQTGKYAENGFVGTCYKYWDNGTIAEVWMHTGGYFRGEKSFWDMFGNEIEEKEFKEMWYCK